MEAPKPKLRVGFLLESFRLPAWQAHLLRRVRENGDAEIVLAILNDQPAQPRTLSRRLFTDAGTILYRVYSCVDRLVFRKPNDAFDLVDVEEFFSDATRMVAHPVRAKYSDTFTTEDVETVRKTNVDVLVRFGFRILRGDILTVAKHGVWSYHHGDPDVKRGAPPGFWEVMEGSPATGVILQILTEDLDNGRILMRSWSRTDSISVHRSKQQLYWKSAEFLPRVLRRLRVEGSLDPQPSGIGGYTHRLYRAPRNGEMLRLLLSHAWRIARYLVREKLRRVQWELLVGTTKPDPIGSVWRYRRVTPPRDRFWADPFLFRHDGKRYLFIEEYHYANQKGHIAVMTEQPDGNWGKPLKILEQSHHLSHAFVFEWNGKTYLIPESLRANRIDVFRCTSFPDEWTFDRTIMDNIAAADPTLHFDGTRWWLFATVQANPGASSWDELCLFLSDSPFGPWTPHPQNPVVSDVRRARPAGSLFIWDGRLYRPAQDGSGSYGSAIQIHEVLELSSETYREMPVTRIAPTWDRAYDGVHTITREDSLTILDARRRI